MAKPNLTTRIAHARIQADLYWNEYSRAASSRSREDRLYSKAVIQLWSDLNTEIERMEERRDRIEYLKEMKAKGRNPVAEEALAAYMAYYKKDGRRRNPQIRG